MEQKAWENLNQDGLLYIELTISFLIGQKRTAPGTSSSGRLYNNHLKDIRGHG